MEQTIEVGGGVYISRADNDAISGIFIYDDFEKVGTVYTRSVEVFEGFYGLKPFNFLFAELRTERENDIYDIYTIDLGKIAIVHNFSHEVSIAKGSDIDEVEQFMISTHPGINRRWARIALKSRDRCFIVRLGDEIAGVGWLSFVNEVGRLHSLYVRPQFRRMGIGEDILNARLLWLRSNNASSAFSEIARDNRSSSGNAIKGKMRASGQLHLYYRNVPERKNGTNDGETRYVLGAPQ